MSTDIVEKKSSGTEGGGGCAQERHDIEHNISVAIAGPIGNDNIPISDQLNEHSGLESDDYFDENQAAAIEILTDLALNNNQERI